MRLRQVETCFVLSKASTSRAVRLALHGSVGGGFLLGARSERSHAKAKRIDH